MLLNPHTLAGMRKLYAVVGGLLLLLCTSRAEAIEVADGKLSIDGFGRWAYGNVVHSQNNYFFSSPGGRYDSGQFALPLTARLADKVVVASQVGVDPDAGGISLDWAYGEYRFSDKFWVHAGR